ncbi:hypothetical protein M409DRAFT_53908 [Zasmidium cellare ATCC 36951]|uniref:NAD(P)-binding protein n=1 Tax=Zasmidium cellare ATCC 36951 TaxID=1080233 RepID=A0A6A6CPC5_ZASCE|nr:uncharacterized protein M409DRAFT_53908 [Zasmidium cellare ATCC 36951]KAF2167970.1 hypothetical protein M409DRAFT_53908 [Zasmidium cellare ATCC 36951]
MSATKLESVFSLARLKASRHEKLHPPAETTPSFKGKTVLITGANTGVDFEAALKFAKLGASQVILGSRSLQKGEDAAAKIKTLVPNCGTIVVWTLDMLDYESIKEFARRAEEEIERLDIAILNAGVVKAKHEASRYGWEQTLQVNVISTAYLALLLLPTLRASRTTTSRPVLIPISSDVHETVLALDPAATSDPQGILEFYSRASTFDSVRQYAVSKLFLEYCICALAALTKPKDPDVLVISTAPGATASGLAHEQPAVLRAAFTLYTAVFQRKTEEGARSYVSAAALGPEAHGRFWQSDELRE